VSQTPRIDDDLDDISREAKRLVRAGIESGEMKLKSGKLLVLDPDQVVRLAQWGAGQGSRRPRLLEKPEDLNFKPTARSETPP
jgi:hypothetical protein